MFCVNCGTKIEPSWNFWPVCACDLHSKNNTQNFTNKDFDIKDGVLVKYYGEAEEIWIPSNVTAIGREAFIEKEYLRSVHIPEGCEKIGYRAFYHCNNLRNVDFPDSLYEIGWSSFGFCKTLSEIQLPPKLKIIERWAFDWTAISEVIIPVSVEKIYYHAFDKVKKIEFKGNLPEIIHDENVDYLEGCCGSDLQSITLFSDYCDAEVIKIIIGKSSNHKVSVKHLCKNCGNILNRIGFWSSKWECPKCGNVSNVKFN